MVDMRHKTGADLTRKEQLIAVVVADDYGVKWIARRVAADGEISSISGLRCGVQAGLAFGPPLGLARYAGVEVHNRVEERAESVRVGSLLCRDGSLIGAVRRSGTDAETGPPPESPTSSR